MGKTSTAAVVRAPGEPFTLESVELDDLRPDEVLVRIQAAGVCHTDMNMQVVVPMPAVLGHEGAGVVEEVGADVTYVKRGDRVILSWPACGECPSCITGKRYNCYQQFGLLFGGCRPDGSRTIKLGDEWIAGSFFQQSSFATHSIVPENLLVRVEDDTPFEILASLPCGVMTGAGSIINALQVGVRDDLMVIGAGGVGLSAVMAGRSCGADPIIAVDINDDRLALAKEIGATHALNATKEDVVARVKQIAPDGLRFVFDTSGVPSSWASALLSLGPAGTFGVGAAPTQDSFGGLDGNVMLSKALKIQFVLAGASIPRIFLPKLIQWYKQGRFPVDRIVKTFAFADINTAFAESVAGNAVKPVLLMK